MDRWAQSGETNLLVNVGRCRCSAVQAWLKHKNRFLGALVCFTPIVSTL